MGNLLTWPGGALPRLPRYFALALVLLPPLQSIMSCFGISPLELRPPKISNAASNRTTIVWM